jgi:hypothetical protein
MPARPPQSRENTERNTHNIQHEETGCGSNVRFVVIAVARDIVVIHENRNLLTDLGTSKDAESASCQTWVQQQRTHYDALRRRQPSASFHVLSLRLSLFNKLRLGLSHGADECRGVCKQKCQEQQRKEYHMQNELLQRWYAKTARRTS